MPVSNHENDRHNLIQTASDDPGAVHDPEKPVAEIPGAGPMFNQRLASFRFRLWTERHYRPL
jgi:hypothetical protein